MNNNVNFKEKCSIDGLTHSLNEINQRNILSRFNIQNQIGQGSFGKVFEIREKNSKKIYAAKVSIQSLEEIDSNTKINLSREVNIISKLNHPCVLKFILFSPIDFKKKKKPVIITEYAKNGTLYELLERERTSQTEVKFNDTLKIIIIYGIVSAMSYIHSNDIIHCDLKPENILLDDFLHPKIADFGLSIINDTFDSPTNNETIKGTPRYISPEIWKSYQYTKACDVYAFAIIVFEIMTLEKPFSDINSYVLMNKIAEGTRPEFNKQIPESYKDLIERCWAENPKDRPTFSDILIELKQNHEFITDKVNEDEFIKFVKFIDGHDISFDSNSFINIENAQKFNLINRSNIKNIKICTQFNCKLFPFKYYCKLCDESRKRVDEAEKGNIDEQYKVGKYLIEGRYDFPQDIVLGEKYLKESMNKGSKKSFIYYIIMHIKGKRIPKNHSQVKELLDKKHSQDDDAIYLLLYGFLCKNEDKIIEAKNFFIQAMEKGNTRAIYEYAKLLLLTNKNESMKFFQEAVRKGSKEAMYKYGSILNNDEGIELIKQSAKKNYSKALYYYYKKFPNQVNSLEYLKKAADKCHIQSMHEYGLLMLNNENGLKEEELLRHLKKASDNGNIDSMYEYGKVIIEGNKNVQSNPKNGSKYIRISANNGHTDAMGYYGKLLLEGKGVAINYKEAIIYLIKGIEKGSGIAMNSYGYAFEYGLGVPLNYEEANKYYKMAIDKGITEAMINHAWMLRYGNGAPINYKEALKYYKMAADNGNMKSYNGLANMYRLGQGVEINYEKAIEYYKRAIEIGSKAAMTNYADMLRNGQGVEVNYKEAIKYYKMAINRGTITPKAMNNYAHMLENGEGTNIDYKEAAKYYSLSLKKGYTDAFVNYANMIFKIQETSQIETAIEYYKIAISKGSTNAMLNYGLLLYDGDKIEMNKEEGLKYIKKAVDYGDKDAINQYEKILAIEQKS